MSPINGFILLSLIITFGFFGAFISFITDYEAEKCEMTYMFEYPQFVRIINQADDKFKKYGLYAYSEGRLTEKVRNMQFMGIPVLFIPGSAGSHKQVRSLSSIALRKALNSRSYYHFDYFTIDLNNELSGLNGALLDEQTEYVQHCIKRIFELYEKKRNPPKSIVLIGHSMGGLIAKSIASNLPEEHVYEIPLVITLSSPLKRPVVELDSYFGSYYKNIEENYNLSGNTTYISIAGGFNDFMVPTYLTRGAHLDVVATSVPKSWVSTDHLSILWCKQLVLAINRALFEVVDPVTRQISTSHKHRLAIFNHHLVKHSGTKYLDRIYYNTTIGLTNSGEWFESIYRQYSVRLPKGTKETKWYMIPIVMKAEHELLNVVALNLKNVDWVFGCPAIGVRATQRICEYGKHLSHVSEIAPSVQYKRRMLRINMHDLKQDYKTATHVVIRVLPTTEPVVLHFDICNVASRITTIDSPPKWYSFGWQTIIERTNEKEIHHEFHLPHLTHLVQTYILNLEPLECIGHAHHATVSLKVPWGHQDSHHYITQTERKPIYLRLFESKPASMKDESAKLVFTLDPTCRYRVSMKNYVHFGNIVRFYSPLLAANVVAVILMTLRSQLKTIGDTGKCSMFSVAMKEGIKPYYIVTVIKVLNKVLTSANELKKLPAPDANVLISENLDFLLLPLIMYIVSVGIVWLMAFALSVAFIFYESTLHKLCLKFFTRAFGGRLLWTDHITKAFEKLPGLVAVILIAISLTTSGGLALCLATVFYFLKLTQMAQDFIEDLVKGWVKGIAFKLKDRILAKIKERWRNRRLDRASLQMKSMPPIEVREDGGGGGGGRNATTDTSGDVISMNNGDVAGTRYGSTAASEAGASSKREEKGKFTIRKGDLDIDLHNKRKQSIKDELSKEIEKLELSSVDDMVKEKVEVSDDDDDDDFELKLEKPMEIEICPGENPESVRKVNGDKLIELLSNPGSDELGSIDINNTTTTTETETIREPSERDVKPNPFKNINLAWIKEIIEHNEIYFHFTIFMLYLVVALLNIPSVLTWAHNFRYNKRLEPDPALIPGVIMSVCALPLWQLEIPKVERQFYKELSHVTYAAAAISLIYGLISIYRLSYLIAVLVTLITLHQMFAINKSEDETTTSDEQDGDDDAKNLYKQKVKDKLE